MCPYLSGEKSKINLTYGLSCDNHRLRERKMSCYGKPLTLISIVKIIGSLIVPLELYNAEYNFMKNKFIIFFSLFALIIGCATNVIDKGFSLSGHKAFEVPPVLNETGETFDYDVTAELTNQIKSALMEKGFSVTDRLENAIIIKSSIISYETGSTRLHCSVKSKLIDKITQKVLGEIVTTRTLHIGGMALTGLDIDQAILHVVTDDLISEVESRIRR